MTGGGVPPSPLFRGVLEWADLVRWTPPITLVGSEEIPSGWQAFVLGELLVRLDQRTPVHGDDEYSMAGVRWYGEGVFHRETVRGKDLSARQLSGLIPGALVYNRLFAWKGAFAVVGTSDKDLYVSNEFPQFAVDDAVSPEYLVLLLTRERTLRAIAGASTGSAAISRSRLDEQAFLRLRVALPPRDLQEQAVRLWRDAKDAFETHRAREADARRRAHVDFLLGLGLRPSAAGTRSSRAFTVAWTQMARWGVRGNYLARFKTDLSQGRFPIVELSQIVEELRYGTSEKANSHGDGLPVLRIGNIKDGAVRLDELKHVPLASNAAASLLLHDGDILVIRTSGSAGLVGTCAVFRERGPFVFASYLIRIRVDRQRILPDYLVLFLNSPVGREQVNILSRKIMQNNINSAELRSLVIPLPPTSEQKVLAETALLTITQASDQRAASADRVRGVSSRLESFVYGGGELEPLD